MFWETKKKYCMTYIIAVFDLLRLSRTEPLNISKVCLYVIFLQLFI